MNISTAPRWSDDDERRELEAMSDSERHQAYIDIFGENSLIKDRASPGYDLARIQQEQQQQQQRRCIGPWKVSELVHLIDSHPSSSKNEALVSALGSAPDIAEAEARLDFFLRRHGNDVPSAYDRVCSYWTIRKRLFKDRYLHALHPPTSVDAALPCSSNASDSRDSIAGLPCALSPEDVGLLQSNLFQILPNDQHGRPVVFFHRSAFWQTQAKNESLMRCWFFVLSAAMQRQSDSHTGIVLLCNFKYFELQTNFDRRSFRSFFRLLVESFPVHTAAVHFCYATRRSAFELVLPIIRQLMGAHLRRRLQIHVGDDRAIRFVLRNSYGIHRIHESLGGDVPSCHDFATWKTQQTISSPTVTGSALVPQGRSEAVDKVAEQSMISADMLSHRMTLIDRIPSSSGRISFTSKKAGSMKRMASSSSTRSTRSPSSSSM